MSAAKPLNDVRYFSRTLMDPETGLSYPEPAPHTFSFNSPSGWCPCCKGLGKVKANDVLMNGDATLNGAIDEAIRQDNWGNCYRNTRRTRRTRRIPKKMNMSFVRSEEESD